MSSLGSGGSSGIGAHISIPVVHISFFVLSTSFSSISLSSPFSLNSHVYTYSFPTSFGSAIISFSYSFHFPHSHTLYIAFFVAFFCSPLHTFSSTLSPSNPLNFISPVKHSVVSSGIVISHTFSVPSIPMFIFVLSSHSSFVISRKSSTSSNLYFTSTTASTLFF